MKSIAAYNSGQESSAWSGRDREIRDGVLKRQFDAHYQPQFDHFGNLHGVEALLRWKHPTRGIIPANEFIHFSEATGLALELGRWTLAVACIQLADWSRKSEMAGFTVAVNISEIQFHVPGFVRQIIAAVDACGADQSRLLLEFPESLLTSCEQDVLSKIKSLADFGVRSAIHDYGNNYHSTLAQAKQGKVAQIKIHRSYTSGLTSRPHNAAMIRAILALAKSLRVEVVVQGLETWDHVSAVLDLGKEAEWMPLLQGNVLGRPVPAAAIDLFNRDIFSKSGFNTHQGMPITNTVGPVPARFLEQLAAG